VYYQGSSREIRRLQSTTRSPVYATFNEVLDGGASIRAFRQQAYFLHLNESQMADLQKANMAGKATTGVNLWHHVFLNICVKACHLSKTVLVPAIAASQLTCYWGALWLSMYGHGDGPSQQ
jgi:hypothetical protein